VFCLLQWKVVWSNTRQRPYFRNDEENLSIWEPPTGISDEELVKLPGAENLHKTPDESVQASHILIKHAGSRRPSSWKEVRGPTLVMVKQKSSHTDRYTFVCSLTSHGLKKRLSQTFRRSNKSYSQSRLKNCRAALLKSPIPNHIARHTVTEETWDRSEEDKCKSLLKIRALACRLAR
jgi:hypothetical protein